MFREAKAARIWLKRTREKGPADTELWNSVEASPQVFDRSSARGNYLTLGKGPMKNK